MSADDFRDLLNVPFRFRRRPPAIPGDLRPDWRIAVLALLLDKCRGKHATLRQLHVLGWAIRSAENQATFLAALAGEQDLERPIVRIEPSLNRAIDYAVGEGLVARSKDRVTLTERGEALVKSVAAAEGVLDAEKAFLRKIDGKITQETIRRVLEWNDIQ